MFQKIIYSVFICFFCWNYSFGQEKFNDFKTTIDTTLTSQTIDPLAPATAAFYSAVLPGLGQAYNKKYWKIPLVYAALGTGVYFYINNKNEYERYQTAFKYRISGRPDEFDGVDGNPNISEDGLIRAQEVLKKNRDLALFITIGLYILNIIEANVDAHLDDKAFNTNLSFRPSLYINPVNNQAVAGVNIKFDF